MNANPRLTPHYRAVVVGGGQAGLAMSEHLSASGLPHLVLERDRIASSWREDRWDLPDRTSSARILRRWRSAGLGT